MLNLLDSLLTFVVYGKKIREGHYFKFYRRGRKVVAISLFTGVRTKNTFSKGATNEDIINWCRELDRNRMQM